MALGGEVGPESTEMMEVRVMEDATGMQTHCTAMSLTQKPTI